MTDLRRPSSAAAPPGMILVMKMPGSSPMCGLSVPPAMLKPNPELPCSHEKQSVTTGTLQAELNLYVVFQNANTSTAHCKQSNRRCNRGNTTPAAVIILMENKQPIVCYCYIEAHVNADTSVRK